MNITDKLLFNNDKNISKNSFFWNLIASFLNAIISAYLLMIVTRFVGIEEGGIFAIASTLAYQFLTIGNYGMRNFQATDTKEIYTFNEYLISRIVTSIIMILGSVVITFYNGYDIDKSLVVVSFVLFKWIDAYEDVYHGFYQQHNRLDVACRIQSFRYVFSLIYFTICTIITKDLFISCITTFIFSLIFFIIFNNIIKSHFNIEKKYDLKKVVHILIDCFPLFISSYLYLYICNSPKYAIDAVLTDTMQSYFGIIFMPVFVINLLSSLIYRPILTKVANQWNNGEKEKMMKSIRKQLLIIFILTISIVTILYFCGTQILGLIYNVNLEKYRLELTLLMIGGGLNAFVGYSLSIITIIRAQKATIFGYGTVAFISLLISHYLIKNYSIMGAAILYDILTGLLGLYFIGIFIYFYKNKKLLTKRGK